MIDGSSMLFWFRCCRRQCLGINACKCKTLGSFVKRLLPSDALACNFVLVMRKAVASAAMHLDTAFREQVKCLLFLA